MYKIAIIFTIIASYLILALIKVGTVTSPCDVDNEQPLYVTIH